MILLSVEACWKVWQRYQFLQKAFSIVEPEPDIFYDLWTAVPDARHWWCIFEVVMSFSGHWVARRALICGVVISPCTRYALGLEIRFANVHTGTVVLESGIRGGIITMLF